MSNRKGDKYSKEFLQWIDENLSYANGDINLPQTHKRVFCHIWFNSSQLGFPRSHLVWYYHYKKWPHKDKIIDHKDGNPSNDDIDNLQEITRSENAKKSKVKANKKEGLPKNVVVYLDPDGRKYYKVRTIINGKSIHMANFKTAEEAIEFEKNKYNYRLESALDV